MNTPAFAFFALAALLAFVTVALLLRPILGPMVRPMLRLLLRRSRPAAAAQSVRSLQTALSLMVVIPAAAAVLYVALGNRAALQAHDPEAQQAAHPTGAADVKRMVQSLARKLEKNPDDLKGWAMLARSWKVMGRYGEAEQAFAKAGKLAEGDPDVLTEYADVVAMRNGGRLAGKSEDLVNKALQLDPNHTTALWMAGTAAYQRKDYPAARRQWERLLAQIPGKSSDREVIRANLEEIRILSGESRAIEVAGTAATSVPRPPGRGKASVSAADVAPSAIHGTVRLAPQILKSASPDDAVFVFARPVEGSRMPLAVLRARVADLPLDFVLDSSNAMNPERTLEQAGVVVVEARVSKHGDAKSQPGDLLGQLDRVKVGAKGVAVVIDKVM
jgi:cytochrome c-type biogenesis protein CcmH